MLYSSRRRIAAAERGLELGRPTANSVSPRMNLADFLSKQSAAQPNGVAVLRGRQMVSFRELELLVWKLARWLRGKGIKPGDVIGLTFVNELQHLAASLALIRLGAVQMALPPSDSAVIHQEIARRARLSLILTAADDSPASSLPMLGIDFQIVAATKGGPDPRARSGDLSAPFMISAGSGTTGKLKLMLRTAEQHLRRAHPAGLGLTSRAGERQLFPSRMDYSGVKRRRLDFLFAGGTNVFLERQDDDVDVVCKYFAVDHLYLVALQASQMLSSHQNDRPGLALPTLRKLQIGSSVITEGLRKALRSRIAANTVVAYGANEVGVVTAASPKLQDRYPGAVGAPLPGFTVEVVDQTDRPLPAGEVGAIRIRSPGMITGYFDDPEATASAFRDGWFYPGDLGALTRDGVLIFHGRADDMMITDGINIHPREVELALESHPQVREAMAFPIPHPVHQELPAALALVSGRVSEAELVAFCRERIGVRAPRRVLVLDDIPAPVRGKVLRRDFCRLLRQAGHLGGPSAPHAAFEGTATSAGRQFG